MTAHTKDFIIVWFLEILTKKITHYFFCETMKFIHESHKNGSVAALLPYAFKINMKQKTNFKILHVDCNKNSLEIYMLSCYHASLHWQILSSVIFPTLKQCSLKKDLSKRSAIMPSDVIILFYIRKLEKQGKFQAQEIVFSCQRNCSNHHRTTTEKVKYFFSFAGLCNNRL